jgi:hypothetical protein
LAAWWGSGNMVGQRDGGGGAATAVAAP